MASRIWSRVSPSGGGSRRSSVAARGGFHGGVVAGGADLAHGSDQAVAGQRPMDLPSSELAAPVGVDDAARDVTVAATVDPAILGGLVVQLGSQLIDGSIRTRLNSFAQAMKG